MFAESDSPACTFLCVTQTHRILLLLRRETGQRCLCTGRVDYRVQHAPDTPMKLAWCVVVASIYSTSVTGFGGTLRYCSRTSQTSPTQVRHKSLRSAGQDQIERGNGFEQSVDKGADVSNYKQTSGPVKAFVGGLTDVFVSFAGRGEDTDDSDASLAPKVSPAQHVEFPRLYSSGMRADLLSTLGGAQRAEQLHGVIASKRRHPRCCLVEPVLLRWRRMVALRSLYYNDGLVDDE